MNNSRRGSEEAVSSLAPIAVRRDAEIYAAAESDLLLVDTPL